MGNPIARSELCNDIRDRLIAASNHYTDAWFSPDTANALAAWVLDVIPSVAWESETEWRLCSDGISSPSARVISEAEMLRIKREGVYLGTMNGCWLESRRVTTWKKDS